MDGTGGVQVFTIGGRRFRTLAEGTIAHDVELLRLLRLAGLQRLSTRDGEAPEDLVWRTIETLLETKTLLPLIACTIVPEECVREPARGLKGFIEQLVGVNRDPAPCGWTPEVQAETVEFLGALDEPEDKQRVYELVAETLFPFLRAGVVSWLRTPLSSAGAAVGPASTSPTKSHGERSAPGAG